MLQSITFTALVLLFFGGASPALFAKTPKQEVITLEGPTMGTTYKVKYFASKATPKTAIIKAGIEKIFIDLNNEMSTYIKNSQISRFNQSKAGEHIFIGSDFAKVVHGAVTISKASGGYFDPTVGPLLKLYSHGYDRQKKLQKLLPDKAKIKRVLGLVGSKYLEIHDKKARSGLYWSLAKTKPGVELDLSAIAKGYGVDKVYEYLVSQGVTSMLVEIGGELRASKIKLSTGGAGGAKNHWRVGIERPAQLRQNNLRSAKPLAIVTLSDTAVATSGNYRNFRMIEGQRVGHVINPLTGDYLQSKVMSVTVLADTCMEADAWATALLAMPQTRIRAKAKELGLKVLWAVTEKNLLGRNRLKVYKSMALKVYEESNGKVVTP